MSEAKPCYLCQMFKTVLVFTFGVVVGLIAGAIFAAMR